MFDFLFRRLVGGFCWGLGLFGGLTVVVVLFRVWLGQ